ncbi:transcription factor GTE5, chloroplastic-like [Trifolium pratense]|uniref:transcription factor GTE5, chloroplastic-like n=1 Tax=Trifolium pratense TaxID=57577 RepID=UPI001E692551|nr:transcription factor GTE5, chloroplastic-like [Trifolium pratense]
MASFDHQQTRKRLIIKLSYPHGSQEDDSQAQGSNKKRRMEKPIVSCYWLDANQPLQKKDNKKIDSKFHAIDHSKDKPSCCLKKKNDCNGGTELMVKEEKKKKPMEHYKRMQCWVIVKRMVEGRDGWALKAPLDIKFLKGCLENKSKVKKAIGLKDIEGKLKSYSSPDEFADDMRFVFNHGMCYPRRDDVFRIAARLSDTFEYKWKVLKKEWALEEKRLMKDRNHKRKRESQSLCPMIR